jgi:hypothetical protein
VSYGINSHLAIAVRETGRLPMKSNGATPMSILTRAGISALAGMGAGLLGFWIAWRSLIGSAFDSVPGPGYDGWLLAGIFIPGSVVAVVVFRQISLATRRHAATPTIQT